MAGRRTMASALFSCRLGPIPAAFNNLEAGGQPQALCVLRLYLIMHRTLIPRRCMRRVPLRELELRAQLLPAKLAVTRPCSPDPETTTRG